MDARSSDGRRRPFGSSTPKPSKARHAVAHDGDGRFSISASDVDEDRARPFQRRLIAAEILPPRWAPGTTETG